jgi:prophage regulatory protein
MLLGVFVMLIDKKRLRAMVLYSPQHIQRLEDAGRFPRRVRLGQGRVGWVETEVLEWLNERIRARDQTSDSSA